MSPQAYLAVIATCQWAATAIALQVTPVQQVINMLTKLQVKGRENAATEQTIYAKYAEWADDRQKELGFEIQDATAKINELVAFIEKADSDVAVLGREVTALDAEIANLDGQRKSAEKTRENEHSEYLTLSQDYAESVDALQRAIQVFTAQNYDRAQAEVLLQKMATSVPGMPRVMAALIQQSLKTEAVDTGAPEVAAYEFQSNNIVELLKGLLDKFRAESADVEKAEANEAHAFAMEKMHLTDTINQATAERDEKAIVKGKKKTASQQAVAELGNTRRGKKTDENLKQEIETTFKSKTATFHANQKTRKDEIVAVDKAIEIISDPTVAESYASHVHSAFIAMPKHVTVSFLQNNRRSFRATALQRAANILGRTAKKLGSKTLSDAAVRVESDPFAKVISMIEDLLDRLKADAAAEADHKAWCDEQLKANKLKRKKKTTEAEQLSAEIEGHKAGIADKTSMIVTLTQEQASLAKAMAETIPQRQAEHDENIATIADAQAGIKAVTRAIVVLKEFYDAQQLPSLLQSRGHSTQVPEMSEYRGMQSGQGGVVGMLEVIQSDFTRLKSETETSEGTAAREHETFMTLSEKSKKQKHDEEFLLSLDKDQQEFEKGQTEKDLRSTRAELEKANSYYQYLKPSCVQVQVSFEERAARREEEINALKEAYAVLDRKSTS